LDPPTTSLKTLLPPSRRNSNSRTSAKFTGLKIDLTDDGITLSQQTYIDKMLERFGMQDCHSVSTPLDPNHKLRSGTSDERIDDITLYHQISGSLMYTVIGTRSDLAYSVTHLSQFSSAPTSTHLRDPGASLLSYLWWNKTVTIEKGC
jgi:hypothetical protein